MKTLFWLVTALNLPLWAQLHFVDKKADGQDPGVEVMRGAYGGAVSPDGRHLYATGSLDHGLVVFAIQPVSGALSFIEDHRDGQNGVTSLAGCRGVAVSPDGAHVYTASLSDSAVTVWSRNASTGALTLVQEIFDENSGGAFDGLGGAMTVVVSPDGADVYVGARSDDAVVAFQRNDTTGVLTLLQVYRNLTPPIVGLDGVTSIVLSPDGAHLYAAAETDQALTAFVRDESTGGLTFIQALFDGINDVDGLGCTNNLAVSPDGAHVYAVGQFGAPSAPFCTEGFDDWLGIFARDGVSGALSFVDTLSPDSFVLPINCGGVAADNGVTVSPDGQTVFATLQWRAALLELARDPGSGSLTLQSFACADLADPDAVIDLISAHRVITDPIGFRALVTCLSPGSAVVYETEDYHAYRLALEAWPDPNIPTLLGLMDLLPGPPGTLPQAE